MNVREDIRFFDMSGYQATPEIAAHAEEGYLRKELKRRFPEEEFLKITVSHNNSGEYHAKAGWFERLWGAGKPIKDLPEYYEVVLLHRTGQLQRN